jgi:hypothetical protein
LSRFGSDLGDIREVDLILDAEGTLAVRPCLVLIQTLVDGSDTEGRCSVRDHREPELHWISSGGVEGLNIEVTRSITYAGKYILKL